MGSESRVVLYELDCAVGQVAVTVGRGVAAALLFHVRTGGGLQLRVVSDEDEVTLLAFHLHRVGVERVMHSPRFSADPAELEVALHAPHPVASESPLRHDTLAAGTTLLGVSTAQVHVLSLLDQQLLPFLNVGAAEGRVRQLLAGQTNLVAISTKYRWGNNSG